MANQIPDELKPAYERPIDIKSIDDRMAKQLEFEKRMRRFTPRDFSNLGNNKPEKTGSKLDRLRKVGRTVLVMAGILAAGYGFTKIAPDDPKPIRPNVASYDYVGHGVQPNVNQDLKSEQK
jgi:hypothetical protein